MNENERFTLTDDELRGFFEADDALLPSKITEEVTPWKKAMRQILVGFGLSALTINYFPLNLVFTLLGAVLSLLGFRSLRKENRAFTLGYALSIVFFVWSYALSVFEACALFGEFSQSTYFRVIQIIFLLLRFAEVVIIVAAVKTVQKKTGDETKSKGISLILWYAILCILALLNYTGFFVALALIVSYIVSIVRLYKFSSVLENSGFAIKPAKVFVGDRAFSVFFAVLLVVSIVSVNVFFGSFPMKFEPRSDETVSEVTAAKEKLSSLGFPENVLCDLSNEDILELKNAKQVVFEKSSSPIFSGVTNANSKEALSGKKRADDIEFTSVAVLVSGKTVVRGDYASDEKPDSVFQEWRIIHHFRKLTGNPQSKTECLEILPAYGSLSYLSGAKTAKGRLLFEKDKESFSGDFYSINDGYKKYDAFSEMFSDTVESHIFADFSIPKGSENFRGYLSYSFSGNFDDSLLNSIVTYYSGYRFPTYPATTAKEYALGLDSSLFTKFADPSPRARSNILF